MVFDGLFLEFEITRSIGLNRLPRVQLVREFEADPVLHCPLPLMALWIVNRPRDKADPGESLVADCLSRLEDDWVICWGYRYGSNGSSDPEREGDFVIQGPTGHVCTIEVKMGQLRHFALTGYWEHDDHDNPAEQLHRECQGVITLLENVSKGDPTPFVSKALALPNVNFVEGDRFRDQLQRSELIDKRGLENFPTWWTTNAVTVPLRISAAKARECFLKAFGSQVTPKAIRFFINETDGLILRQLDAEALVLDIVAGNQQLIIEGGCGSGKTFLAIEQARRWAESDSGRRVLLLCYNLSLCEQLADLIMRKPPKKGEVVVRSWEAIAMMILEKADIAFSIPADTNDHWNYFNIEVPGLLLAMLEDGDFSAEFDALVIDEAQDHDTHFPTELCADDKPGWWSFYFPLLREGRQSKIAIFYDSAQRPIFRDPSAFSIARLMECFSQPARVRLPHSLRYTRPVYEFLRKLTVPGSSAYGASLGSPVYLGEGPDVVIEESSQPETVNQVTTIAKHWIERGLCRPCDIMVLGLRRDRTRSSLGSAQCLGDIPLCDYSPTISPGSIPYLNIHRSKGLDRLAIILIDLAPWTELVREKNEGDLEAYFAGASRARQLLAVIHRNIVPAPPKNTSENRVNCPYCHVSVVEKNLRRHHAKSCRKVPVVGNPLEEQPLVQCPWCEITIRSSNIEAHKSMRCQSAPKDVLLVRRKRISARTGQLPNVSMRSANDRYMKAQFESRSD